MVIDSRIFSLSAICIVSQCLVSQSMSAFQIEEAFNNDFMIAIWNIRLTIENRLMSVSALLVSLSLSLTPHSRRL